MEIYLRELTHEDLITINGWRNNKELVDQLGANFHFINIETDNQWFDNYMNNRTNQIRCAIVNNETKKIIGVIYLLSIDFVNRKADLSIFIGDIENHNKGYGSQAIIKMLKHAFDDINLNRVSLIVLSDNIRAINVYKKCGFSEEGLIRQYAFKNGSYKDMIIMSILRQEFLHKSS
jgi:UDP-4-amino-4,6-dideoxy-N-acetyl-beta-L-altrosamine N-acetyltransferase